VRKGCATVIRELNSDAADDMLTDAPGHPIEGYKRLWGRDSMLRGGPRKDLS